MKNLMVSSRIKKVSIKSMSFNSPGSARKPTNMLLVPERKKETRKISN